jgi:hypothetical protein
MVICGGIASGSRVVKDAQFRDALAKDKDALCFEMEAVASRPTNVEPGSGKSPGPVLHSTSQMWYAKMCNLSYQLSALFIVHLGRQSWDSIDAFDVVCRITAKELNSWHSEG